MQPKKYFGTDGIRGKVGEFPINANFLLNLGWAVGKALAQEENKKVLIGKDTRISGYMIESALQAGLSSAGINIYLLGPIPTSAIAYLTKTLRGQIGIVISASHNPYYDNGIKFFSADGYKLPEHVEHEIEKWLDQPMETSQLTMLGKAYRVDDAQGRYIEFCKSAVPHHTNFNHLKIVIDCANGATYHIAPNVFYELGANVIPIFITPDGLNINEACGSTHPEVIKKYVLETKADVGIAFDGDGDRVVMIDHKGEILDGDELLFIITKGLLTANTFSGGVVLTHMSNLGLELALHKENIPTIRVPVGDQHVIQGMLEKKWWLGGEPSGHIIYSKVTTAADGIITALQVLQTMHAEGKSLHELKQDIKKFPQRVINVCHNGKHIDLEHADIAELITDAKQKLSPHGRVLIRYSGTEPIIRIMVEGENESLVNTLAQSLADEISHSVT